MKSIQRTVENQIKSYFFQEKAILIYGARQVGKTTLIQRILTEEKAEDVLFLNGDEPDIRELFQNITSTQIKSLIGNKKILFIDEAQRISNIGLSIKLIVDQIKEVQVIASGSTAFDLANKVQEPLTGRKFEWQLFPLSFSERANHFGLLEEKRLLHNRLIYGSYPEIVTHPSRERELLGLLTESYLYKDILMLDGIQKPALVEKLVTALSLQVGNEVSYNELAKTVSSDPATVEKYIHILEKAFIVFVVPAFSRNVRTEIKKGKKIYFYDNGIRNAIIQNLNPQCGDTELSTIGIENRQRRFVGKFFNERKKKIISKLKIKRKTILLENYRTTGN